MTVKVPTYSICNLRGVHHCMTEFTAYRIRDFMENHDSLVFPHRHNFFQIVLFTTGGGSHSIDFQHYEIIPGQLYCMKPGQMHSWSFTPETEGYIVNFNETFITTACHNPNFMDDFPMFGTLRNPEQLNPEARLQIESHLKALFHEYETYQGEFQADLMRAMLMQLLIFIARSIEDPAVAGISKHSLALLRDFQKLIDQHYRSLRLPKAYADMLFITPNHLNAVCNAVAGKSAGELIRDRVLLEAKRMLAQKQPTISEIGYALDFKDNAYFSRFFKKYTSQTPEEFRKNRGNFTSETPVQHRP